MREFNFVMFWKLLSVVVFIMILSAIIVYFENSLIFYFSGLVAFYTIVGFIIYSIINELASRILSVDLFSLKSIFIIAIVISTLTAAEGIAHRCAITISWIKR